MAAKAALRVLKKAERTAIKSGVDLTPWEGEFLSDVSKRVKTYGRAYADPDKGAPGHALSMMQAFKLSQIMAKAKGDSGKHGRWGKKQPKPSDSESDDEDG